jgi:hypothetical protein
MMVGGLFLGGRGGCMRRVAYDGRVVRAMIHVAIIVMNTSTNQAPTRPNAHLASNLSFFSYSGIATTTAKPRR